MTRVALRTLAAARWRLLLTAIAVMLGVAFVAGTFVLTDSTRRAFDGAVAQAVDGVDVVVRGSAVVADDAREPVDPAVVERIRGVEGVRAAEGTASADARVIGADGEAVGSFLSSAETWTTDAGLSAWSLRDGAAPASGTEVVLDAGTADGEGIAVGDTVTVQFPVGTRRVMVSGIARYGGDDSLAGGTTVLVAPSAAPALLDVDGDGIAQDDLAARVGAALPDGVEAVTGDAYADEQGESAGELLTIFRGVLLAFGFVSLFVGAFIIVNTFAITLAQRQRQLALLRAIGASPAQVVRSVMAEALVVGVVASVLGLVAGIGVAAGIAGLLDATGAGLPLDGLTLAPRTVALALALGIGVTLVAALRPAVRAARIAPVAALRDAAVTTEAPAGRRRLVAGSVAALGVALLALGLATDIAPPVALAGAGAALTALGAAGLLREVARPLAGLVGAPLGALGLSARLGRANAMRSPQRTARTAAALMIGLALVTGASVFAASLKATVGSVLDERVRAQAIVTSDLAPFPGDVADVLSEAPGITDATVVRSASARVDGRAVDVASADPATLDRAWDIGVTSGSLAALRSEGTVMVAERVARAEGLTAGDTVRALFGPGRERTLRVVGTFEDTTLGEWLVDPATFRAEATGARLEVAFVNGTGDADTAVAAAEAALAAFPTLEVRTRDGYIAFQERSIDQVLAVVVALLGMALVIAVVGIVNTLALSVIERTREIGMLRAVGMERRAVRRMVRVEAVVTALVGAVAGIALGVPLGAAVALRVPGIDQVSIPGGYAVAALLGAAVAGIVAAALPARRAARLDVLRAVTAE